LLDQNAPIGLRKRLSGHEAWTAYEIGWTKLGNGQLFVAAEAVGVAVLVTCDQNIKAQQDLADRPERLPDVADAGVEDVVGVAAGEIAVIAQ
jgi:hypothetical protein